MGILQEGKVLLININFSKYMTYNIFYGQHEPKN